MYCRLLGIGCGILNTTLIRKTLMHSFQKLVHNTTDDEAVEMYATVALIWIV